MTPSGESSRSDPYRAYPHRVSPLEPSRPRPGPGDLAGQLGELVEFENVLGPFGFQGLIVACAACPEEHLRSWASMRADLWHQLTTATPPTHEPPFEPDLLAFITHDYARGFTDALNRDG